MTKFTEGRHDTEGLLSEGDFAYSRATITVLSGQGVIKPGAVLGKIAVGGKYVLAPAAEAVGEEGAEVASAIALYECDATSADATVVAIVRHAQWNKNTLSYDSSVDTDNEKAAKIAELAAVGIICR